MPHRPFPRVLVVEDDPGMIFLLRMLFIGWLWDPVVANCARAAEKELADGNFDLVVLDLMLPDANGIEILRALKSRPDAPPVIVSTGNDAPRVMEAVDRLKPDAVFLKSVNFEAMQEFVDALRAKLRPPL